jgi:hypothetical protein
VLKTVQLNPAAEGTGSSATAAIIYQEGIMSLVVQGNQLQQLEGSQAYQVWLIEGDKKKSSRNICPE